MDLNIRLMIFAVVVVWMLGEEVAPCRLVPKDKKDKKEEEEDKKPKKKGEKVPSPLPDVVYGYLDSVQLSSYAVMINGMKNYDACNDEKTFRKEAAARCAQVVSLLDRMPPYMRKEGCRHVIGGFCKKVVKQQQEQEQKPDNEKELKKEEYECTLKTYHYKKCGPATIGWTVDHTNQIPFKDCVGDAKWDTDRHNAWRASLRPTSATGTPSTPDNKRPSTSEPDGAKSPGTAEGIPTDVEELQGNTVNVH